MSSETNRAGIVIPTIGGRPDYLPLTLESIRKAGPAYVVLVGNKGFDATAFLRSGLVDAYFDEPVPSLPQKINFGFSKLPTDVEFINWIGDDDLLTPDSLTFSIERISRDDKPVMVFGGCEYIDATGASLFTNKSGSWAVGLLRFGPQLIPQPGALYRRDTFEMIGGLSDKYGWAFDFDLFYRLSKVGKVVYLPKVLAKFRWHSGSLSVGKRKQSVREASLVRVSHLPSWLKPISVIWEIPVRYLTLLAGLRVSRKYLR